MNIVRATGSGHYCRNLTTTSGDVTLKVPKLKGISFETASLSGIAVGRAIIVIEKVVRRIMRENQLIVKRSKIRKYNSYQGEISPEAPNIVAQNFRSAKPNQKWLTDITEFSIPAGKVYTRRAAGKYHA